MSHDIISDRLREHAGQTKAMVSRIASAPIKSHSPSVGGRRRNDRYMGVALLSNFRLAQARRAS